MSSSPHDGWSLDFSDSYLQSIYAALADSFELHVLGGAQQALESGTRCAFVRHDVDVSLERAVRLAQLEADWGIASTYHMMLDSPFYQVDDDASRERIRSIMNLGHEVGLHFDPEAKGLSADAVLRDVTVLEDVIGVEVRSMSFHRPMPELLRGPLLVGGRVSGYAAPLMESYLSDSAGRWREGDPVDSIHAITGNAAQVLVHPEWWGPEHLAGPDRLDVLATDLASELGWTYADVADTIARHIGVEPRTPRIVE